MVTETVGFGSQKKLSNERLNVLLSMDGRKKSVTPGSVLQ